MDKGENTSNWQFLFFSQCILNCQRQNPMIEDNFGKPKLLFFGKDKLGSQFLYLPSILKNILNSLPNDKILNWIKLIAFADDKLNSAEKLKFVLERIENSVGTGENACYQHFLLLPQCFQKASDTGC